MKIIVDTCIWSLALRRNNLEDNPYVEEFYLALPRLELT